MGTNYPFTRAPSGAAAIQSSLRCVYAKTTHVAAGLVQRTAPMARRDPQGTASAAVDACRADYTRPAAIKSLDMATPASKVRRSAERGLDPPAADVVLGLLRAGIPVAGDDLACQMPLPRVSSTDTPPS
jgi:hypothetical protein